MCTRTVIHGFLSSIVRFDQSPDLFEIITAFAFPEVSSRLCDWFDLTLFFFTCSSLLVASVNQWKFDYVFSKGDTREHLSMPKPDLLLYCLVIMCPSEYFQGILVRSLFWNTLQLCWVLKLLLSPCHQWNQCSWWSKGEKERKSPEAIEIPSLLFLPEKHGVGEA